MCQQRRGAERRRRGVRRWRKPSGNDSRSSFERRGPGPTGRRGDAAVLPITRGTKVWLESPLNCLISTASTSMLAILRVEKLNDTLEGIGDVVRDKQQPQMSRGEVRGHALPEARRHPALGQASTASQALRWDRDLWRPLTPRTHDAAYPPSTSAQRAPRTPASAHDGAADLGA